MIEQDRFNEMQEVARKQKIEHFRKCTALQMVMQLAIHQMNAPLRDTAALIVAQSKSCAVCGDPAAALVGAEYRCGRCESAGRWAHTQAMERRENRKGLIFWCRVMVLASIAGWVIGFIVK